MIHPSSRGNGRMWMCRLVVSATTSCRSHTRSQAKHCLRYLNQITTEGRRLGAISDMNISDMSANAPVGTTLALLERTLKPMAAVQARVHYAMKQEFKMLKTIMSEYAPTEYDYIPMRGEVSARVADYMMVDVIPVSDPNSSTMAQRVVQYQAVLQMAHSAPQIYDLPQLHRQMIEVLGVKNADKLVPTQDDLKPTDPVSENMDALNGKPLKAFIYQDHDAHITTHQAFMQDPMVAQMIGQNPQGQAIMAALQAHLAQHLGFQYRKQMEEKTWSTAPCTERRTPREYRSILGAAYGQGRDPTYSKPPAATSTDGSAATSARPYRPDATSRNWQIKQQEVQRKMQKDAADIQLRKQNRNASRRKMRLMQPWTRNNLSSTNKNLLSRPRKTGSR